MGAETSTLQSIDSLSKTLIDIEQKLSNIETLQFHHERTIALDNTILIADKVITCNSQVKLTVGPIIGIVSSDYVRILIETNIDANITFYIFEINSLFQLRPQFIYEHEIFFHANIPTTNTFERLKQNTTYIVYLGGLNYSGNSITLYLHSNNSYFH